MNDAMKQTTNLRIEGMTCANCAVHVEKALEAVPGVISVSVQLDKGAHVEHAGVDEVSLKRAVAAAGAYNAEVIR
jgi:copper chaperone CopZ